MNTDYKKIIFTSSYVDGAWTESRLGRGSFEIMNPATGEILAEVFDGGVPVVEAAIAAAHAALPEWRAKTAKDRSSILEKWWALVLEHQEELATLITLECGKPIKESRGEVLYAASFIKWFAEEGRRTYGSVIPTYANDRRVVALKQAIGVVGAITPWNFPLAMITRKIAPALAAGCTVVTRPSEETPLSALALAHFAEQAGFPPGVLNVTVGKDASEMGKVLCASEVVRKISFTGSTRVGSILMEQSAPSIKKLSLELGGNAPFIVFEDADLDAAVKGAVASKYRNAGQTCVCVNRFIVHEKVYDEFMKKLIHAVSQLQCGNGLDESTDIGPLISSKAVHKVYEFVEDAKAKGGKVLYQGSELGGQFVSPIVIGEATSSMRFAQEETFGPISPVFKFSTDEEAIAMANDTIYGLASYMYSQSPARCWKVAEALEYGMVGINEGLISTEVAPFGGVKSSGLGREGSQYGIDDYLEIKYMCWGGLSSSN